MVYPSLCSTYFEKIAFLERQAGVDWSTLRIKLRGSKIGDRAVHVHDYVWMECEEVANALIQKRSFCAKRSNPGAPVEIRR